MASELVMMNLGDDQDSGRYRATMFTGPDRLVKVAAALLKAGHSLEPQEGVPGLWRIDGGPELTTNQMLGVAADLVPQHVNGER